MWTWRCLHNVSTPRSVGGAKDQDLSRFGSQLAILRAYAAQHGGRAMFFYDTGTPIRVIEFAAKRLGPENVQPIP